MGARTFIQATKKGDASFLYAILAPNPRMKSLFNTKTIKMFLKRKM